VMKSERDKLAMDRLALIIICLAMLFWDENSTMSKTQSSRRARAPLNPLTMRGEMPVQNAAGLVDLSQCGMLVIRHERNHAGEALVIS
jgi:hypothetical protein